MWLTIGVVGLDGGRTRAVFLPRYAGGAVMVVVVIPPPSLLSDPSECFANAVGKITLGLRCVSSGLFFSCVVVDTNGARLFGKVASRGRSATVSLALLTSYRAGGCAVANVAKVSALP